MTSVAAHLAPRIGSGGVRAIIDFTSSNRLGPGGFVALSFTDMWRKETIVSERLARILAGIDVRLNGDRPQDIRIHDERAFARILGDHGLGLGETYMEGWWDCSQLDELISRLLGSGIPIDRPSLLLETRKLAAKAFNFQSKSRASQVCETHYDLGNNLFKKMLDPRMVYSCAYWKGAATLEVAQEQKLDLICRKLGLQPGMTILDIGCGWGSFMKFASERYGVRCVGYTLSPRQLELGRELCAGHDIEFRLADYRDIQGEYDRVVSVGMLEAVGWKNYGTFAQVVTRSLKPDGLALIHTMGRNDSSVHTNAWVDRYIFPNGINPSIQQLGKAFEGLLMMEDWHNFGPDYDPTLMEWNRRFQSSWRELEPHYTPRFKRMWEFYLLSFAGNFRARNLHLWQIVLSKPGRRQPECRIS